MYIISHTKQLLVALLAAIAIMLLPATEVSAQIVSTPDVPPINKDSLLRDFDSRPSFGLYKDNYFLAGIPIGEKIDRNTCNAKFQISISQRLTKTTLPFGTYLYLFYSQKCFWNVLQKSMPMTDLNFNPGIGLAKPLFYRNRFIGKLMLLLEHESNGRDGLESRSWNKISFGANIMIDPNLIVHGKTWIPIIDSDNNLDILKYCGIYQMGLQVISNNQKFNGGITLTKRQGWNLNYNTIVEVGYRFSRRSNQYFYVQYYNGYGEGLLNYKKFTSMLRVGLVIKPTLFSDY